MWIGFPHPALLTHTCLPGPRCGGSTWNAAPAFWWMSWAWWIELKLGTGSSSCLPRRCSVPGSRKPRACQKEVTVGLIASFFWVFEMLSLLVGLLVEIGLVVRWRAEPAGRSLLLRVT